MKGSIQFRLNRSNRKRAKRAELFFKALFHNAHQLGRVHIAMATLKQPLEDLRLSMSGGKEPDVVMPTRDFSSLATELVRKYTVPSKLEGPRTAAEHL